ncbi:27 kDa glycoprotein-like [Anopheles aquasalis]|uniref:27 kDa glycoprotein-like n=1 Tax=Anopheles aquasalis TaxID=42839 RepID=UPI00215AAE00|nr:27 kDa glycoprotein-like [Anopheles aquasalis]
MSKWSVTLLFIGLALFLVCDGSPLSHESSDPDEMYTAGMPGFAKRLFKECKKNTGSIFAFAAVMEAYANSTMCLSQFDGQSFMMAVDQLTDATRTAFFSKYCAEARTLFSCFDAVQASSRPCLNERDFNLLKGVTNSIPKALDLVCKNDGEIIYKLKSEKNQVCFMQKVDQLKMCVSTFETSWNYDWNAAELTKDQCSVITSYRQCMKEQLDACNLSDALRIFDIVKDAFLLQTPCVNSKVDLIDMNSANEV